MHEHSRSLSEYPPQMKVFVVAHAIDSPIEEKEFKKLIKTNKNVLVLCSTNDLEAKSGLQLLKQIESSIKGRGTLLYLNCEKGKKLCKKLKIDPDKFEFRSYLDGEFHKLYDRPLTTKSMINFILDPKGDMPWSEVEEARNVLHLNTVKDFQKALQLPKNMLVMFYAPWCGYCTKLKPDYAQAASEITGRGVIMAGMDVDKAENYPIRQKFNITGFPTILYFEKGEMKFPYAGEMNKNGLISWLKDPKPVAPAKQEEDLFAIDGDRDDYIVHLNDSTFDTFEQLTLLTGVALKPHFIEASKNMMEQNINGILVAIDSTQSPELSKHHKIKGFPTSKKIFN
ncbi:unnamed protein product [Didymodactylos carnosus]|uniref:Thioredoxin domain-containing protein n=1 Tax=Didymodactylos carnosus TaxID=1234261 RepID=A0A8S2DLM2_9BILA|nr:unnamed protein product [Didymodactylos carnosus]CAF3771770.1 unnamed protein product [Didymodactylos carnosus]